METVQLQKRAEEHGKFPFAKALPNMKARHKQLGCYRCCYCKNETTPLASVPRLQNSKHESGDTSRAPSPTVKSRSIAGTKTQERIEPASVPASPERFSKKNSTARETSACSILATISLHNSADSCSTSGCDGNRAASEESGRTRQISLRQGFAQHEGSTQATRMLSLLLLQE
jgi:hypothetical protein